MTGRHYKRSARCVPAWVLAVSVSASAQAGTEASSAARDAGDKLSSSSVQVSTPLTREQLLSAVERAEQLLFAGRALAAAELLGQYVDSSRFAAWRRRPVGRAATFFLAKAQGALGAGSASRRHLGRLLRDSSSDPWFGRGLRLWVELGVRDRSPERWLKGIADLQVTSGTLGFGDLAYLRGRVAEIRGRWAAALSHYGQVDERSKFWAPARYRSGLLHVEQGQMPLAETQFCQVADPRETPRLAPVTGGRAFFDVRDLSRLALGRLAHEQLRFDDALAYYHRVPGDSQYLAEALYESATARYEAGDYESAQVLLEQLAGLDQQHPYRDEAWILEAYVNLARCRFNPANELLEEFERRYQPVVSLIDQLQQDPLSLVEFLGESIGHSGGPVPLRGIQSEVVSRLRAMIRSDEGFTRAVRELELASTQGDTLVAIQNQLAAMLRRAQGGEGPVLGAALKPSVDESPELRAVEGQLILARAELLAIESSGQQPEVAAALRRQLQRLEVAVEKQAIRNAPERNLDLATTSAASEAAAAIAKQLEITARLRAESLGVRSDLAARVEQLGMEGLARLERRLSRLMRRATAGRVETILAAKESLEGEIEALSKGVLPPGAVDSLDVAQYLQQDEEYWPLDGEDWADEYVGGEGL